MLQIRQEQWDVFVEIHEREYRDRLGAYLVRKYGRWLTEGEMEDISPLVEWGLARARDYGITASSEIQTFFSLMLTVSRAFDLHPEVRGILCDEALEQGEKIDMLLKEVPEATWERIAGRGAGVGRD